jgi:integrase
MVFNKYKTFKVYGRSIIDVKTKAPLLNSIIKKWIKINQNDYLLFGDTNKQLSVSQLTKINNNIWNKKVSCDMYRHIFLTNFYSGAMPSLAEMDTLSKEMGHSIIQSMLYIKQD